MQQSTFVNYCTGLVLVKSWYWSSISEELVLISLLVFKIFIMCMSPS